MMKGGRPSIDDTDRRPARNPDDLSPLRIYLIRHGETAWSLTGQHTGKTDIALTQHGEEQAFALAPVLGAIEFSHVLTSPAVRALRTCKLAGFAAQAVTSADLAEWDYGDYEGKRSSDIHQFRPDWNVFQDGCPGGESVRDVTARADRVIASLRRLSGNVLLFSHGQFGRSLAARWIGLAIVEAQHLQIDPASISVLAHDPAHPEMAVIARWNDTPATTVHQSQASRLAKDA
jgi:broad specificity phosphatase PhoE